MENKKVDFAILIGAVIIIFFLFLFSLTNNTLIMSVLSDNSSTPNLQEVTEQGSETNISILLSEGLTTNNICLGSECKSDWNLVNGVTGEYLATYTASKGNQLMTNNWLLQDTLYNWRQESNLARPIELYSKDSAGYKHSVLIYDTTRVVSNELIPVDNTKIYSGSIWLRNVNGTAGSIFSGLQAFDKYGHSIGVNQYSVSNVNKRTYLAQPFCPGETKVYVDDISTWDTSNSTVHQRVTFFIDSYYRENYFDHYYGSQWAPYYNNNVMNYTENSVILNTPLPSLSVLQDPNGIYRLPLNETCLPIGTPVANTFVGASYNYFIHGGTLVTTLQNWTYREGFIRPRILTELGNPTDQFRPGTSFVRVLTLGSGIPLGQAFLVDGLQMKEYERNIKETSPTRPYMTFGLVYHLNPKIQIRDNRIEWFQSSTTSAEYTVDTQLYRETTARLRTEGSLRVDGTVFYGALSALSPHALLGEKDIGYTRICKQATNGKVVMEKIELINGEYKSVYYENEEDCQKVQLVESHEKEYEKVDSNTMIERTHGLYKNVWTDETEVSYKEEVVEIPEYSIGEIYSVGQLFKFNNEIYEVLQTHTTQEDWIPSLVPAIYKKYIDYTAPSQWTQPQGGHDCYPLNALVTFNGQTYKSTHSCNVWAPTVYGWVIN